MLVYLVQQLLCVHAHQRARRKNTVAVLSADPLIKSAFEARCNARVAALVGEAAVFRRSFDLLPVFYDSAHGRLVEDEIQTESIFGPACYYCLRRLLPCLLFSAMFLSKRLLLLKRERVRHFGEFSVRY